VTFSKSDHTRGRQRRYTLSLISSISIALWNVLEHGVVMTDGTINILNANAEAIKETWPLIPTKDQPHLLEIKGLLLIQQSHQTSG